MKGDSIKRFWKINNLNVVDSSSNDLSLENDFKSNRSSTNGAKIKWIYLDNLVGLKFFLQTEVVKRLIFNR